MWQLLNEKWKNKFHPIQFRENIKGLPLLLGFTHQYWAIRLQCKLIFSKYASFD